MHSLRRRLLAGILTGLVVLLGAGGATAYFNIKDRLYRDFDLNLAQRAVSLASMIEEEAGVIKIEWLEHEAELPGRLQGIDYFSVWKKQGGELLNASVGMQAHPLPRFGGSLAEPELREALLPGDRPGRCVGVAFRPRRTSEHDEGEGHTGVAGHAAATGSGTELQLVIAKVDTVASTLEAMKRPLVGFGAAGTVLAGILIWLVVNGALRPLDELKRQIGSLNEAAPGARIKVARQPAELEPVTRELNHLLERVELALVRERTLTSNVAHELRTPIAGLLSILEVTLSRFRSAGEYRESTQECLEIAKRLHWLANSLLSISRIEAGTVRLQNHPVPLERALPEWWEPFAGGAEARGVQVEWEIQPGARLQTDPEFLRIVMTNLFDNAVSYTQEGGKIHVTVDAAGNISVANQAVDLNSQDVERAFDPFWRKTESREGAAGHAGLGLNLCKKIIELLGGRISARIKESERLFEVRLEMA